MKKELMFRNIVQRPAAGQTNERDILPALMFWKENERPFLWQVSLTFDSEREKRCQAYSGSNLR